MNKKYVDLKGYLPQLSLKERDRRWSAVRELMGLHDLDCLLAIGNDRFFGYGNSNVRYLTQIDGQRMERVVIFPLEHAPVVFGTPPHMHDKPFPVYKAFNSWVTETHSMSGLKPAVETLKAMGYEQSNIGLVSFKGAFKSHTVSYQEYQFLLNELPKVNFIDATPLLDTLRMIKSLEEIEMLKKSGELSRLKVEAMISMARPGVKECELYAEDGENRNQPWGRGLYIQSSCLGLCDRYWTYPTSPSRAGSELVTNNPSPSERRSHHH